MNALFWVDLAVLVFLILLLGSLLHFAKGIVDWVLIWAITLLTAVAFLNTYDAIQAGLYR